MSWISMDEDGSYVGEIVGMEEEEVIPAEIWKVECHAALLFLEGRGGGTIVVFHEC